MQHLMAEQTPPHDHVPWVTIDREQSALAEKDLRCAICTSSAGKEDALSEFCANKSGCDRQRQQQPEPQEEALSVAVDEVYYSASQDEV
ncbi:interferon gamma-inducible protein [Cyclospora cayetanensis]|uniref:Interferon gamma-inducible protein n=1 Tax=Cyclospora cayetanensis TaxID=88456 RepID=A0A1D3D7J0_9EIME|nr:interferon gamma-inducible protein [Cyclospora cayetanensis]